MQCSLYGKVPAKRDFIAIGAPREFLNVWEPWLQGSISASRTTLCEKWQSAFLTAPIWRFWLGADICGRSVIGAFMSSLDGIGRYFPLTLFACADDDAAIPPPELGAQDDWFDSAEAFLMSTLDHDAKFEAMTANLGALPPPSQDLRETTEQNTVGDRNGRHATPMRGRRFGELFESIRRRDHASIYAGSTFWWTIGGAGFAPVALPRKGMPDPFLFSAMLTGDFADAPA
jgi:type VI secretion system protein ImpM